MLPIDTIPQQEPTIHIGIIMPEDQYSEITINCPISPSYKLEYSGKAIGIKPNAEIGLKLVINGIRLKMGAHTITAFDEVKIGIDNISFTPHQKSGLRVKDVIAGRGFHWKKHLDVFLPGSVIIKRVENQLVLINELPLEQYVMCVATSEMGAACPPALIESQTIVARSWILANIEQKHRHLGMDACNDDCCQRYQGSTHLSTQSVKGAQNTYGQVLLYEGQICDARYSKSCGGVTESFESVWGGEPLPYMKAIPDAATLPVELLGPLNVEANFIKWVNSQPDTFCSPSTTPENELKQYLGNVDEAGKYFRWEITVSQGELISSINRHQAVNARAIKSLRPLKRGGSGRITRLEVKYFDQEAKERTLTLESEYAIRQALHKSFMYSSAVIITPHNEVAGLPQKFHILGAGWGHGAGYCQIGALGMALKGYATKAIVLHYYPGSELTKIYDK